MKIYKYGLLVLGLLAVSSLLQAAGITFTFDNGMITGTSPKYYEFDIMVQGSVGSSTKIGHCQAYVNYNSTAFGTGIHGAGDVTVTKGTFINNAFYSLGLNDNTSSRLSIDIDYLLGATAPELGSDLPASPASPEQWAHVVIEIQNESESAGLSFESGLMTNQAFESDPDNQYSPVTATDTDDSSLPVQMSEMTAESTIEGIELSWATQSEVNSLGFRIWRAAQPDADYEQITTALITSQGNNSSGAEYHFVDEGVQQSGTLYYRIEEISAEGFSTFYGPIEVEALFIPTEFSMSQNYPNPFNPMTTFTYDVPEVSDVTITVYSLLGKEIKTIYSKQQMPGRYTEVWDGTDNAGRKLASGVYFLRMQAGSFTKLRKMTLIR